MVDWTLTKSDNLLKISDCYHHTPKLSNKTQMRTAQDIADDLSFFY